jgi:hypothetical protein
VASEEEEEVIGLKEGRSVTAVLPFEVDVVVFGLGFELAIKEAVG